MTIYCYTISLQGPAEDVWYFKDLLDEALDAPNLFTKHIMEDDLMDVTIDYETKYRYTRDQLDNLLTDCYNIFHEYEIDCGIITGTWVIRKAKINM